jgi:hypothetical protein
MLEVDGFNPPIPIGILPAVISNSLNIAEKICVIVNCAASQLPSFISSHENG